MKITCSPARGDPFAASPAQRPCDAALPGFGHPVHTIGPLDGRSGRRLPYGPINVTETPAA